MDDTSIADILRQRPLAPTDVNLFSPAAYPDATPLVPAAGPPPTEDEVRAMLRDYLAAEFPSDHQAQAEGFALFDDPATVANHPSLRTGFVGLLGASGEPAIDAILNAETSEGLWTRLATRSYGTSWRTSPSRAPACPENPDFSMETLAFLDANSDSRVLYVADESGVPVVVRDLELAFERDTGAGRREHEHEHEPAAMNHHLPRSARPAPSRRSSHPSSWWFARPSAA